MTARPVRIVVLTGLALVLLAAPARGHTRFADATNFDSRVTSAPGLPGATWRLFDGGEIVQVTNRSGTDLMVRGYRREPYLRVGPSGVYENLNSPATYLNREPFGDVAVPPRADPAAPPEWTRVGSGPTHSWHDHRTHWMATELPPPVRAAPDRPLLVQRWELPVSYAGRDLVVAGELHWVPPHSPLPWLLLSLAVVVPTLVGLRSARRRTALRAAAATVAAVAVANTAHLPDEVLARPAETLDIGFGLLHTLLFVGAGLGGAWWAWRGRWGARLALGIGSGAVLFHQGLLHLPVLGASQLPTIWPAGFVRLLVAASLAQAFAAAVALAATRPRPAVPDRRDAGIEVELAVE